jgi:hypothetical protein
MEYVVASFESFMVFLMSLYKKKGWKDLNFSYFNMFYLYVVFAFLKNFNWVGF